MSADAGRAVGDGASGVLYPCCPHCLDHENTGHEDAPCDEPGCPGGRAAGGAE